jgi:hypothetical protein
MMPKRHEVRLIVRIKPMSALKYCLLTPLVLICLVVCGAQFSLAASKDPTTWWPDPKTGGRIKAQSPQWD